MTIHENYSLKHLNTFGVEVKAKQFVEIFSENELIEFLKSNKIISHNLLVLGGGSNILFLKDYEGTVLKYSSKGIRIISESDSEVIIKAEAGEVWDDLVSFCVKNNYYGIENLSLIPGTVGAAPIQNIGAYGVEIKDVFESLEGFVIETSEKKIIENVECRFDYRNSIFKNQLHNKFIITTVTIKLSKQKKFNLNYRALSDYFGKINVEQLTIKDVSDAIIKIRTSKLPDVKQFGNAGSFFKNPEITEGQFTQLQGTFHDIVFHKVKDGLYKIPAGWLIEKCGFKGIRKGNVGVFEKQSLVIINYGNASGEEIKRFSQSIRDKVYKTFRINLETEVNII